jgi:hypothetical protein
VSHWRGTFTVRYGGNLQEHCGRGCHALDRGEVRKVPGKVDFDRISDTITKKPFSSPSAHGGVVEQMPSPSGVGGEPLARRANGGDLLCPIILFISLLSVKPRPAIHEKSPKSGRLK